MRFVLSFSHFDPERTEVAASLAAYTSSSVHTLKVNRVFGRKVWVTGTVAAWRPWAIKTRPIRGMLLRASKVYQRPPIKASHQPAKSPGGPGHGMAISPRQ